jgi:hypothetical protein
MMQTWFVVPRAGTYTVGLRVSFADGRFGERTVAVEFQDWFVVSLGDSSASGEGNPDEWGSVDVLSRGVCDNPTLGAAVREVKPAMNNPVRWSEQGAHRSIQSGPALAALSLQRNTGYTFRQPATQVNWISLDKITFATFARSGAGIIVGLVDNQGGASDYIGAGQIEECRRAAAGRKIDALMINIGGNDAHFSGVLTDLVKNDSPYTASLKGGAKEFVKDFIVPLGFLLPSPRRTSSNRETVEARLNALLGVGLAWLQRGD